MAPTGFWDFMGLQTVGGSAEITSKGGDGPQSSSSLSPKRYTYLLKRPEGKQSPTTKPPRASQKRMLIR